MLINAYYRNDFSYSVESGGITNRDAVMVSMKVDTGSQETPKESIKPSFPSGFARTGQCSNESN